MSQDNIFNYQITDNESCYLWETLMHESNTTPLKWFKRVISASKLPGSNTYAPIHIGNFVPCIWFHESI